MIELRKDNGAALSVATQHARLTAVKAYFKWMAKKNLVLSTRRRRSSCPGWDVDSPGTCSRLRRRTR